MSKIRDRVRIGARKRQKGMVRKINKINRQDQYRPRSKIYIWMRICSRTRRQDEEQGAVTG